MNIYSVKQLRDKSEFTVTVPGSKSITNRALMLSALCNGVCVLEGVLFSDDSRAFLDCLIQLGYKLEIEENIQRVTIEGNGGEIPNRNAVINVRSAGTAARFLTVMLALAGGNYRLESSEQMKKRPMEPLITLLREIGVDIKCIEKEGHFPFYINSRGINVNEVSIDTEVSSQFASALLLAGNLVKGGLKVTLTGSRTEGSYIQITRKMLEQFGIGYSKENSVYTLKEGAVSSLQKYIIEPDVSAACYFWGIAAINSRKVRVKGVSLNSMQGDLKFLKILQEMGCTIGEDSEGLWVLGNGKLKGISVDLKDFSDQAMTLAAIAPFAEGTTKIKNISHIRHQESDRIEAIMQNLQGIGIECDLINENGEEGIKVVSGEVKPGDIETYEDHRVAMAFAMIGTRCKGIRIINPECCGKTFENYFEVLEEITE